MVVRCIDDFPKPQSEIFAVVLAKIVDEDVGFLPDKIHALDVRCTKELPRAQLTSDWQLRCLKIFL